MNRPQVTVKEVTLARPLVGIGVSGSTSYLSTKSHPGWTMVIDFERRCLKLKTPKWGTVWLPLEQVIFFREAPTPKKVEPAPVVAQAAPTKHK